MGCWDFGWEGLGGAVDDDDQSKGWPLFMIRDIVGGAGGLAAAARPGGAVLAPAAYPPDYRNPAELRLAKPREGVS